MSINLQDVLIALGGQAAFLGAVAWLAKSLVSHRLAREAEEFRIKLKADADLAIERLKSSLQMVAAEHQIRFTKLHEQRVEIISRLSRELVEVPSVVRQYVVTNVKDDRSYVAARDRALDLRHLVQVNRILLPDHVCVMLDQVSDRLLHIVTFIWVFWTIVETPNPETRNVQDKEMKEAVSALEDEIPALREKLMTEFRTLLAGTER